MPETKQHCPGCRACGEQKVRHTCPGALMGQAEREAIAAAIKEEAGGSDHAHWESLHELAEEILDEKFTPKGA